MLRMFLRRPWFAITVILGVLIWQDMIPSWLLWAVFITVAFVFAFIGYATGQFGRRRR